MIGIPLGLLYANAAEWLAHKYILHGLGKSKANWWSFHWHDHHRAARKHGHIDAKYRESPWSEDTPQRRELIALGLATAAHLPLFAVAPFFTSAVVYSACNYYRVHRKSHIDPTWAREHLPWHYDHHMGPNQHANWCVTKPWFDHLMGTREPYVGTERETSDRAKRLVRQQRKAARLAQAALRVAASTGSEQSAVPRVQIPHGQAANSETERPVVRLVQAAQSEAANSETEHKAAS